MNQNRLKKVIINKLNKMYKIRGKITNLENVDINTAKGDFTKKLITIEELDTGFNHIQQFEVFGKESISVIETTEKLQEGQIVNLNFYIKSREYNSKFYNTLMIKEARIENTILNKENNPPF